MLTILTFHLLIGLIAVFVNPLLCLLFYWAYMELGVEEINDIKNFYTLKAVVTAMPYTLIIGLLYIPIYIILVPILLVTALSFRWADFVDKK